MLAAVAAIGCTGGGDDEDVVTAVPVQVRDVETGDVEDVVVATGNLRSSVAASVRRRRMTATPRPTKIGVYDSITCSRASSTVCRPGLDQSISAVLRARSPTPGSPVSWKAAQ